MLIVSVLSGCSDEISSPVTESSIALRQNDYTCNQEHKAASHEEVVIDKKIQGLKKNKFAYIRLKVYQIKSDLQDMTMILCFLWDVLMMGFYSLIFN